MKKTYIILLVLASSLAVLASCQKEIVLPYRSIDPIAVIEGSICQDSTVVKISTTVDMEASFSEAGTGSGADVSISYDGRALRLAEVSPGMYKPAEEFQPEAGKEYRLSVAYGGNEYSSSSTMQPEIQVQKAGFRSMSLVGYKSWLYSAVILDTPGEDNYYAYYFYEDGKLFYSDMIYDTGHDGEPISIDIPVESDDEAVNGTDMHNTLPEGGTAVLEIRSVDSKTFNYLYSLMVTQICFSNPLQDFEVKSSDGNTPPCAGYFSAYSSKNITEIFHRQETFPSDSTE